MSSLRKSSRLASQRRLLRRHEEAKVEEAEADTDEAHEARRILTAASPEGGGVGGEQVPPDAQGPGVDDEEEASPGTTPEAPGAQQPSEDVEPENAGGGEAEDQGDRIANDWHHPMYHDAVLIIGGGQTHHHLRRPSLPADRATSRHTLKSPLTSLAMRLTPEQIIIDCGVAGQCRPNAISILLGLLGLYEMDGYQLRQDIVQYVRNSNVLEHDTALSSSLTQCVKVHLKSYGIDNAPPLGKRRRTRLVGFARTQITC